MHSDEPWNFNNFTEKHSIINVNPLSDRIPGVQTSFVNVGMEETWFCAHKEDSDIASMNVLLQGAPKIWYIVPYEDADKYEMLFNELLGRKSTFKCQTPIRHKCFIIAPWILEQRGIKLIKHIQRSNDNVYLVRRVSFRL